MLVCVCVCVCVRCLKNKVEIREDVRNNSRQDIKHRDAITLFSRLKLRLKNRKLNESQI